MSEEVEVPQPVPAPPRHPTVVRTVSIQPRALVSPSLPSSSTSQWSAIGTDPGARGKTHWRRLSRNVFATHWPHLCSCFIFVSSLSFEDKHRQRRQHSTSHHDGDPLSSSPWKSHASRKDHAHHSPTGPGCRKSRFKPTDEQHEAKYSTSNNPLSFSVFLYVQSFWFYHRRYFRCFYF